MRVRGFIKGTSLLLAALVLMVSGEDVPAEQAVDGRRVEMVTPLDGRQVRGEWGVVAVGRGFTDLELFGHARFELAGADGGFVPIAEDRDGTDGFAVLWDTREVPNGNYRIRVTLTGVQQKASAQTTVQVDNRPGLRFSRSDMDFEDRTDERIPRIVNVNYGIDAADLDGDGDVDLWVADCGRVGDQLLINDGNGTFSDETEERLSRPDASGHWRRTSFGEDAVFADVDGDGDLDVYVNSDLSNHPDTSAEPEALFINDGTGQFVDEIEARLPMDVLWRQGTSDWAEFADVDGDGDLDLVRSTRAPLASAPIEQTGRTGLFLNDGDGVFTDSTDRLPNDAGRYAAGFGLADVDLDGAVDIVLAHHDISSGRPESALSVYLNDGNARFDDANRRFWPRQAARDVGFIGRFALGDVDNDGDTDLVAPASGAVLKNDSEAGRFRPEGIPMTDGSHLAAVLRDVDNDGYADLIAAQVRNVEGKETHHPVLLLNDRRGGFRSPRTIAEMPAETHIQEIGLADVDADGDLDLYVGTGVPKHDMIGGTQRDRLFINTLLHPTSP